MRSEAWLEITNGEAWLSGKPVLRNLNLKLWLGESTTILGPNGAGKSSLVKLIDRSLHPIVRPQAELRLFGQTNVNLWDLRQRIGVVTTELEGRFPPSAAAREVVLSGYFGSMRLGRDQLPTAEHHQPGEGETHHREQVGKGNHKTGGLELEAPAHPTTCALQTDEHAGNQYK